MTLFYILTIITFFDAYKNRLLSLVLKLIPQKQNPLIKSMGRDIFNLEKDLRTISITNEFAAYCKLSRRITKLKDDRKKLVEEQSYADLKIKHFVMTISRILVFLSLLILMWLYRSESVAEIPPHWLWPLSSFFNLFNGVPGSISVPCWIAISSVAAKNFAQHF